MGISETGKKNPKKKLGWNKKLKQALEGTTRVRIREKGLPGYDKNISQKAKTIVELRNANQIRKFIQKLEVKEEKNPGQCKCFGGPTIEFYKEGNLVVTIGLQHWQNLRWWKGSWPGDLEMTKETKEYLRTLIKPYKREKKKKLDKKK